MQPNNNNPFNGPISKLAGCRKKHLSTSVKWPNTQLHLWQPTPEMSSILQACGMTCNQSTSTDNSRKTGCWLHWLIVRYWPTPLSGSQFWHASSAVASAQPFLLHKERVVHVDACGKTRSISHIVTSYPNTDRRWTIMPALSRWQCHQLPDVTGHTAHDDNTAGKL